MKIFRLINQTAIEKAIENTPTGPDRNALCDFNIRMQEVGTRIDAEDAIFIPVNATDELINTLENSEYYYVVTSGGYRECWKGYAIKATASGKRIKSILIQHQNVEKK